MREVFEFLAIGPEDWLWFGLIEVLFAVGVRMKCSRMCAGSGIFSATSSWVELRVKIIP